MRKLKGDISMKLPAALESYRKEIMATLAPTIHIELAHSNPTIFTSKVGGNPYFLKEDVYPAGADGTPLRLLAQINFAEMPVGLADFPTEGIVQFYIHPTDDCMGLNFDDGQKQKDFRVIYHEHLIEDESKLINDFSFAKQEDEDGPLDFDKNYGMTFKLDEEVMSMADYRFEEQVGIDMDNDDLIDAYFEEVEQQGHKIGGYPHFTQDDPRAYGKYKEQDILLFQLDSDDDFEIMWGDVGVGNFLISREDLKQRRFEQVLYNWDCY